MLNVKWLGQCPSSVEQSTSCQKNIRVLLYKSLINVHLDYCNLLWGSASQSLIKPLVSMQKKAICSALNAPYNSHTNPLFAEINSLKFEDQYQLNAQPGANGRIAQHLINILSTRTE
jgi:hypothetical protein